MGKGPGKQQIKQDAETTEQPYQQQAGTGADAPEQQQAEDNQQAAGQQGLAQGKYRCRAGQHGSQIPTGLAACMQDRREPAQ